MLKGFKRFDEGISTNEMDAYINDLKGSLVELSTGNFSLEEVNGLIESLINEQDSDGFWGIITSPRVPSDIRVAYWYIPTYISTSIMMKYLMLPIDDSMRIDIKETLKKGLLASTGRAFNGHGYGDIAGRLDAIEIFNKGEVARFLNHYPDICPEFTDNFNELIKWLKNAVETKGTKGAWGEDYKDKMEEVLNDFNKDNDLDNQPLHRDSVNRNKEYIWYACYGSNINEERFMRYIEDCSDKTPPINKRAFDINYSIYFANNSKRWGNKGVAFLDTSKTGFSYGKAYLIRKDQFVEIREQEGPNWYNEIVDLGLLDGIPVKTFTHSPKYENSKLPSIEYLDIIKSGIKDTYSEISENDIDAYIMASYLGDDEIEVLKFLRSQPHGVSIEKISNELKMNANKVIETVSNLLELELIRQDRRSIEQGISWNSIEAIYYTIKHRRVAIDKVLESTRLELTEIIDKNIKELSDEELLEIINALPRLPQQRRSATTNYTRSEYIKEYTKHRANGVCELCNKPAPFINSNGEPYLEVHHIKWLSEGGEDSVDNTAALCPNCHRKMHILNDKEDVRKLQGIVKFSWNNN